jgi:hypothetical protein
MKFLIDLAIEYQHIFTAIGAFGSIIAAFASLYLIFKKAKPKIKVALYTITHGEYLDNQNINYEFIVCKIKNIGSCAVEIDGDSFKICGKTVDPIDRVYQDYTMIDRPYEEFNYEYYVSKNESEIYNPLARKLKKYPFCIKSGYSKSFYILGKYSKIDDENFIKQLEEKEINIKDNFSFDVLVNDHFNFKAKIEDRLKARINKVIKKVK